MTKTATFSAVVACARHLYTGKPQDIWMLYPSYKGSYNECVDTIGWVLHK
jgi:hypothetical protein